MANENSAVASVPKAMHPWTPDVVFSTLGDPVRRGLLLALARGGSKTGADLKMSVSRKLGATLKHLAILCASGFVVKTPNPKDGRQPLYTLSVSVPITTSPTGKIIDFGFCTLNLAAFLMRPETT